MRWLSAILSLPIMIYSCIGSYSSQLEINSISTITLLIQWKCSFFIAGLRLTVPNYIGLTLDLNDYHPQAYGIFKPFPYLFHPNPITNTKINMEKWRATIEVSFSLSHPCSLHFLPEFVESDVFKFSEVHLMAIEYIIKIPRTSL